MFCKKETDFRNLNMPLTRRTLVQYRGGKCWESRKLRDFGRDFFPTPKGKHQKGNLQESHWHSYDFIKESAQQINPVGFFSANSDRMRSRVFELEKRPLIPTAEWRELKVIAGCSSRSEAMCSPFV